MSLNKFSQAQKEQKFNKKQSNTPAHSKSSNVKPTTHGVNENLTKEKTACRHCGKSNHTVPSCKYREYNCKIPMKKVGHLAQICRSNLDVKRWN